METGDEMEFADSVNELESGAQRTFNPWFSIWIRPRATIQQIVETDPHKTVLLLAAAAGISRALDRASFRNLGDRAEWPVIVGAAVVVGPVAGIIGLYVSGALVGWTGKWIGGAAPSENIRAAVAWSNVPVVWTLILWIPQLALFGQELFTSATPRLDANPLLGLTLLAFALTELTLGLWAIVIFLKCLAQVQGFSAWSALGNVLLAAMVVVVPLVIIAIALIILIG